MGGGPRGPLPPPLPPCPARADVTFVVPQNRGPTSRATFPRYAFPEREYLQEKWD